jgi:type III secretory pathway component EscT
MIKKIALTSLIGAGLTLQAGFFDDAMQQAGNMMQTQQPATSPSSTPPHTSQQKNALLSQLTSQLGVTPKQAAGGTAALMNVAAQSMPQTNYAELLKSVPGLSSLVQGNEALVNGAAQMIGNSGMVDSAFQALGMDSGMVGQFAPIILNYAKQYATPENIALLKQAWSAFL